MIRFGRRSLSDDAQVVRVARERDDMMQHRAAGVPAWWMSRFADRLHRSHLHARSKTLVAEQQIVYPPTRTHPGPIGLNAPRERRIRLERSDPKHVRHASFIATNPLHSGKPQGR
jgi:hypothetical protein